MPNQLEPSSSSSSLPTAVQRAAFALRRGGWICFWVQLVLGVVSTLILLFATLFAFGNTGGNNSGDPGSNGGLFFAVLGLGTLAYSVYRAFSYTRLAQKLRTSPSTLRPSKGDTLRIVKFGLMWNLAGMSLTLVGAEAINGTLLAKSLSQPRGFYNALPNLTEFIQPLDIFIVLANTHTIVAHFVGISTSLWLINKICDKDKE